MKALTIWQPWASLIIAGAKPYEFRGWRAPRFIIGQRIVIHAAAKKIDREELSDMFHVLALRDRDDRIAQAAAETCLRPELAIPLVIARCKANCQRQLVLEPLLSAIHGMAGILQRNLAWREQTTATATSTPTGAGPC